MLSKEIIRNNFSKYARTYDQYSQIQNLCAAELIAKVKTNGFKRVLDLGCGTGNYTRLLRAKFPFASIRALDISQEMIQVCRKKLAGENIEFIVADAEGISFPERFDLISSNAAFQWFEDLEEAFKRYRGLLKKEGFILFSLFGPLSFRELRQSLEEFYGEKIFLTASRFLDKPQVEEMLKSFFRKTEIREEIYKKEYASLADLLKSIKYTGTKGQGLSGGKPWSKESLEAIEEIYKDKFKKIVATYQVFFCQGAR